MIKHIYFALTLWVTLWSVYINVYTVVYNFCLYVRSTHLPQNLIEEIGRTTEILEKSSFPEKLGSQAIIYVIYS